MKISDTVGGANGACRTSSCMIVRRAYCCRTQSVPPNSRCLKASCQSFTSKLHVEAPRQRALQSFMAALHFKGSLQSALQCFMSKRHLQAPHQTTTSNHRAQGASCRRPSLLTKVSSRRTQAFSRRISYASRWVDTVENDGVPLPSMKVSTRGTQALARRHSYAFRWVYAVENNGVPLPSFSCAPRAIKSPIT
jgi:hypothetical protein